MGLFLLTVNVIRKIVRKLVLRSFEDRENYLCDAFRVALVFCDFSAASDITAKGS
jgi:hypothetical protein